jgi:RHS repeat-associated protein
VHDLDYMHARFSSRLVGRFLLVDPATPPDVTMRRPQMWNRYTYTIGNPLTWIDPTGEVICLANLTEEQRRKLLERLEAFTGSK